MATYNVVGFSSHPSHCVFLVLVFSAFFFLLADVGTASSSPSPVVGLIGGFSACIGSVCFVSFWREDGDLSLGRFGFGLLGDSWEPVVRSIV